MTTKLWSRNNDPPLVCATGHPTSSLYSTYDQSPPHFVVKICVSFTTKNYRGKHAPCPLTGSGFTWTGTGGAGSEEVPTSGDVGSGASSITSPHCVATAPVQASVPPSVEGHSPTTYFLSASGWALLSSLSHRQKLSASSFCCCISVRGLL